MKSFNIPTIIFEDTSDSWRVANAYNWFLPLLELGIEAEEETSSFGAVHNEKEIGAL